MENVQDKKIIITGGSRGIGYDMATELLRKNAKKIAIIDLPLTRCQEAVATLQEKFGKERVIYFPCDMTKTEDFKETFREIVRAFNGLDVLINNAGICNCSMIQQTFNINVVALIHGSFMALDYMGKHKGGKGGTILNMASISGLVPVPCLIVYSASKFAVVAFSRCLEAFYDKTNIRVLTLCPSLTKTQMCLGPIIKDDKLDFVDKELIQDMFNDNVIQSSEHVANTAVDLIQKGKNGTIWVVEGNQPGFSVEVPLYVRK